jgi:hypothetical protein
MLLLNGLFRFGITDTVERCDSACRVFQEIGLWLCCDDDVEKERKLLHGVAYFMLTPLHSETTRQQTI